MFGMPVGAHHSHKRRFAVVLSAYVFIMYFQRKLCQGGDSVSSQI